MDDRHGIVIGSRLVKGYDVNLMHHRMEMDHEYNYCPYCGEYIGKSEVESGDNK